MMCYFGKLAPGKKKKYIKKKSRQDFEINCDT